MRASAVKYLCPYINVHVTTILSVCNCNNMYATRYSKIHIFVHVPHIDFKTETQKNVFMVYAACTAGL